MISIELSMTDNELKQFIKLVYEHTGIRMHEGKRALLINRINKRLRALGLGGFQAYLDFLTNPVTGKNEISSFIDAVTTNETYFFRAPKMWEYFKDVFLTKQHKENPGTQVQIWSAASSSGEEPYTIAIICSEFAEKNPGFKWALKASDISEEMLQKCRMGTYEGRSIELLTAQQRQKYFTSDENNKLTVKAELRQHVSFFRHNLKSKPEFGSYHIVFLRNVMIYFDAETKKTIINHVCDVLKPGGTLIIGESEGLQGYSENFKYIQPSIYTKTIPSNSV